MGQRASIVHDRGDDAVDPSRTVLAARPVAQRPLSVMLKADYQVLVQGGGPHVPIKAVLGAFAWSAWPCMRACWSRTGLDARLAMPAVAVGAQASGLL